MTDRIKFAAGTVVATIGATHAATRPELLKLLQRHLNGDWGDLDAEDKKANEWAVKHGARLLSAYDVDGTKLWVITESSREQTTILTPSEY